jgi:hypothetical protein
LVAKELTDNYGWTQTKIAKKLGVTQAAVSGYLTQNIEDMPPFNIEEMRSIAKGLTSEMVLKKLNHSDLINNVCEICLSLRRGGAVCRAHKTRIPELDEERCTICMQLHMSISDISDARRNALSELRCAVSLLESSPEFADLVPEVFTNVVMGVDHAKGIADVAGIPGRLVKVRGKIKALMEPEFGVSSHMAKLLLAAMSHNPKVRSIINLKYSEAMVRTMNKLEMKHVVLHRDPAFKGTEDELFQFVDRSFAKERGLAAVVDGGGFGIEPNTYIFDESASQLADKVVRIARMISVATRK